LVGELVYNELARKGPLNDNGCDQLIFGSSLIVLDPESDRTHHPSLKIDITRFGVKIHIINKLRLDDRDRRRIQVYLHAYKEMKF